MKLISLTGLILLLGLGSCQAVKPTKLNQKESITYCKHDSLKITEIINQTTKQTLEDNGKRFIGTDYIPHTLEHNKQEQLVVNLTQFDCTTFIETCLALFLTQNETPPTFSSYCRILENIRYRQGKIQDYSSRLHYFTEWIEQNEENGHIENITLQLGGQPFQPSINFMSTHPNAYEQLKADSSLIPKIKTTEKRLSEKQTFFIGKQNIQSIENQLEEGMIIGITTNINGLDFIHTGILVKQDGRIHLLHASSDYGKVMITEQPLNEYLANNKRQTGIVVLKVKSPNHNQQKN